MSKEIERKFLINNPKDLAREVEKIWPNRYIYQGYLIVGQEEVRVRRMNNPIQCFLTIKSGSGMVREETKIEITEKQWKELWKATDGRRISKRRLKYKLKLDQPTFEFDTFLEPSGLITVEVEFKTEKEARDYIPPEWFGKEVTGSIALSNAMISVNGIPEWVKHYMESEKVTYNTLYDCWLSAMKGTRWNPHGAKNAQEFVGFQDRESEAQMDAMEGVEEEQMQAQEEQHYAEQDMQDQAEAEAQADADAEAQYYHEQGGPEE